ncbi:selenocysteine synthase [Pantoea agglomerans]|uniref:Selenocysteine synthase n=1 Tax=Enterobacter agglomerans TaxID=549 RepID=A0A379AAH0_ENTAG|nr:selenocysteine synthase [Pantoea agglomerans]
MIYSGAKAIEGPTSGLVIGRHHYVEWVKRQTNGIGRAMKVGKEGILGLTQAIENYLTQPKISGAQMVEKMTPFIEQLNSLNGVTAPGSVGRSRTRHRPVLRSSSTKPRSSSAPAIWCRR